MKKGNLVIELVISMAIMFLIIGAVSNLFISEYKSFKKSVIEMKKENSIEDAFTYIEALVGSEDIEEIKVEDNCLKIKKQNRKSYVIRKKNNVVGIDYYERTYLKKFLTLVEEVSELNIEKDKNLLFITIILDNEESRDERCISIKREDTL